jgi:hypothetical protein
MSLCKTPNTGLSSSGKTRLDKERLAQCQAELVSLLRMRKLNRGWLAHCQQAELVSLLHMHNHKKKPLAQWQAELVSLLHMHL